ncbi:MerC domain-containing protein [Motilimonas pumila]|uniref:MerC domain-containing protein n=1 Tax=Motilimonas pumila TaxID=2303987 RepID=A0A418YK80_9GAMM|nr:MerC domain-containing protein [Motilimonas pumila]RJG51378.1 MerC domain-containing protein [Motilimonas pumila]
MISTRLDKFAISLSGLCLAHCLLLPIALTFIPALTSLGLADERFHQLLLLFVIPTSLVALTLGCKKHQSKVPFAWGLAGLSLLIAGAVLGHDLGEIAEKGLTFAGACIMAFSHFKNYRLCQKHDDCKCHSQTDC